MARSRRKHSAEFKRDAVRLTHEPGRTVGEVATSLGLDRSQRQRWKSEIDAHGASAFPGNGRAKASDAVRSQALLRRSRRCRKR